MPTLFGKRYADGQRLEIEGVPLRLKVNLRARRITLRIDALAREAVAVAPSISALSRAVNFAIERKTWLHTRLASLPASVALTQATTVDVFGSPYALVPDGRRPSLQPGTADQVGRLTGCGDGQIDAQLVVRALKLEARRVFGAQAQIHCQALGVATPPILLTDTKSRWGSCVSAATGRAAQIRLSWRLAMAPFEVADYVVAHECAHLREANHGPAFWALTQQLVGNEKPHRAWLRAHGQSLHNFGAA